MTKSRFHQQTSRWGAVLIMALLLSMMTMPVLAADPATLQVLVDGQEMDYGDAPPIVQDNRTYVGVRALGLALGISEDRIQWNGEAQTASLSKDNTIVVLTLGSNIMQVNDGIKQMDAIPFASDNRIYLPVRYLAEAFGFTVNYDEPTNRALLTSPAGPNIPNDTNGVVTPSTMTVELTEAANNTTVTAPVGGRIEVALASNPSTGYSWQLAEVPDGTILESQPPVFEPGSSSLVGAAGTETWAFRVLNAGSTSFKLQYSRPDSNGVPSKIFTLNVTAK